MSRHSRDRGVLKPLSPRKLGDFPYKGQRECGDPPPYFAAAGTAAKPVALASAPVAARSQPTGLLSRNVPLRPSHGGGEKVAGRVKKCSKSFPLPCLRRNSLPPWATPFGTLREPYCLSRNRGSWGDNAVECTPPTPRSFCFRRKQNERNFYILFVLFIWRAMPLRRPRAVIVNPAAF